MAKKTQALSTQTVATPLMAEAKASYSGDFTGTFKGDLTGNATTATSLENSFRVTVVGNDASGYFETSGKNATLNLKVTHATSAEKAKTADTATSVHRAAIADTASFATSAGSATEAIHAGNADAAIEADHAKAADKAGSATTAISAQTAEQANKAKLADKATSADSATEATHAKTADKALELDANGTPVPEAKHAQEADLAKIAWYDCNGLSFVDYYAKKSEIKDFLTKDEASDLYIPRAEQVLQAVVVGKAYGHGFLNGNTLRILITSVCCDCDGSNLYNHIKFVDKFVEEGADTTKIYVDGRNHMFLFDPEINDFGALGLGHWVEITSSLDKETQERLDNALAKLEDVVTIHGDQTIKDHKVFENTVQAEIADIENDNPRTVVTVHNLRDVMDRLTAMIAAVSAAGWEWAYIDYSLASNQDGMVAHKTYWGLLDSDKNFLPINPETGKPFNLDAKPAYIRHYRKASNGTVSYYDLDVTDHSLYARLDGATFTGPVHVPSIDLDAEPSDLAINFMDVKHLIKDMIEDAQIGRVWKFLGERPTTYEEIPVGQIGLYEVHPVAPEEDFAWTYIGDRPTEATLPSLNIHDVLLYNAEPVVQEEDSAWTYIGDRPTDAAGLSIKDVLLYNAEQTEYGPNDILKGRLFATHPEPLTIDNHEVVIYQDDKDTLIKD